METEERVLKGMLKRAEGMYNNYFELANHYEQEVNVLKNQLKNLKDEK